MKEMAERAAAPHTFRTCGSCSRRWSSMAEFLDDRELSVVGLQVAGHMPEVNLMIFQHACGSTVSVLTARLRSLLPPPPNPATADLYGTERCRDHCLRLADWEACDLPCINAGDRRLLQAILRRKADPTSPPDAAHPPDSGPAPAR